MAACLLCMNSCAHKSAHEKSQAAMAKKGGLVITLAVSQPELTDSVISLLEARLANYGAKNTYVSISADGQIHAQVPGVTDEEDAELVRMLLTSRGELEIWETYNLSELLSALTALNATDSIFTVLQPYINDEGEPMRGPIAGRVQLDNKDAVMAELTSPVAQALLPADVRFRWSSSVVSYEYAELIALKARDGKPAFTGECLTDVESMKTKDCPYPNISMVMGDADTWERFTGENVGRSIAFVVDGAVYSFPMVVAAIPGGKSQISGNMTFEEAAALAAIIKFGPLPCEASVMEENIVNPK
ncbi:MAG: hypothetical protein IJT12_07170 [Paludibacteraceae bacterium]|nr:hypothetical protein [Paludibacteraceae bacterium]